MPTHEKSSKQRSRSPANDPGPGGDQVNLDDDSLERPRGNTTRTGGTWQAQGGDSGRIDHAPGAGLSDRNGPSDRSPGKAGRP